MQSELVALVDRNRERAAIENALQNCRNGIGQLLVFEGAPGLGKTSLLEIADCRAGEERIRTLHARGSKFECSFPFGVVRQLFEGWLSQVNSKERQLIFRGPARSAAKLFEYDAQGLGSPEGEIRHNVLNGLYWMCVHIAERAPLAILIDNICCIDEPSARFLHFLSSRFHDLPILLTVTIELTCAGLSAEIVRAIISNPVTQLFRLAPFSANGIRRQAEALLGGEPKPELVIACLEATGGIPFFTQELLGEIAAAKRHGVEFAPASVSTIAPPKVISFVRRILAKVPPFAVSLSNAIAVLGSEADFKHALKLSGIEPELAIEALGILADCGLLNPNSPYRFVHPIIRESIYQSISASERSATHSRAVAILGAAAAPAKEIAEHLLRSPIVDGHDAVSFLRTAARNALIDGQHATAIGYLTRAIQEPSETEVLVDLLVDLGLAELGAHLPEALDHLSQAMALCESVTMRSRIGLDVAMAFLAQARDDEAVSLLNRLRETPQGDNSELSVLLEMALLSAQQQTSRVSPNSNRQLRQPTEDACPDMQRLLAVEKAAKAQRLGTTASNIGSILNSVVHQARADGIVLSSSHDVAASSWFLAAVILAQCDRLNDADYILTLVLEAAVIRGLMLAADTAHSLRAWVRCQRGQLVEAESDALKALERTGSFGTRSSSCAFAIAALVDVLTHRNDFVAAEAVLDQYELHDSVKRSVRYTPVLIARARLHAAKGQTDAALEDFQRGCSRLVDSGRPQLALRYTSEAAITLIQDKRLLEAQKKASSLLLKANSFGAPRAIAAALRVSGLAADGGADVSALEQAVEMLASSEARLEYATALIDLGAVLCQKGRNSQARRRLTVGLDVAAGCGAWGLVKTARGELSGIGVRVRTTEARGSESLTSQELRVAALAVQGKSNRDIAHELFVTIKTVEWHLNRSYRKLGITSRGELDDALDDEVLETALSA